MSEDEPVYRRLIKEGLTHSEALLAIQIMHSATRMTHLIGARWNTARIAHAVLAELYLEEGTKATSSVTTHHATKTSRTPHSTR